ncbi:hypothetical protein HYH03_016727 [Edaphochlamys debaryana]|uniref:Uncharacterized protein n=1 Tax=Edaphochlamys debaryana TaxID=47281 RepID=A0A836BRB9_9CHLO|nr:hypothetical protein HYH03_016727 [Edaphochlamys debaryana]|eukprot:KAG2484498.1 hypothetical protein HYH03_016727 [Edaphochlamys debaryana]
MPEPFMGSDAAPPPGGPVDVKVSALLERIIGGSGPRQAAWWVILTWPDPTAGAAVEAATGAAVAPNGPPCARSCESGGLASAGCCDRVWLPRLHVLNVVEYPQDQLLRYQINANKTSGIVTWSTRLVATWYSPFDFRAYPFEHQHLLLELGLADSQAAQAGLRWEHVAKLNNTPHTKGADLAGWRMKWGKGKLYDSRKCMTEYGVAAPTYNLSGARASGGPAVYESIPASVHHWPNNTGAGTTEPDPCSLGGYTSVYDEGRALFPPVVLVADVMIKRVSSYYVLTNLVPVLLITLVAFVTFFMPTDALGDRMSVVLTMFLSLTAMQFVFDFPPANYINALQQVVLVSYIMIALACVESLIVNRLSTVSYIVGNKRGVVKRYQQLLAKAAFERYLSRELFPHAKGNGAVYTSGVSGGIAGGKPHVVRRGPAGAGGGGKARYGGGGKAGGGGSGVTARREDSAMGGIVIPEEQHVVISIPPPQPSPAPPTPQRAAARASPGRHRRGAAPTSPPSLTNPSPNPTTTTAYPPAAAPINRRATTGSSICSASAEGDGDAEDGGSERGDRVAELYHPHTHTHGSGNGGGNGGHGSDPTAFGGGAGTGTGFSPFASARTQASFSSGAAPGPGAGGTTGTGAGTTAGTAYYPPSDFGDGRSVCSVRSGSTAIGGPMAAAANWRRRLAALGLVGSLKAFLVAACAWVVGVATAPASYYRQCKEDPEFAMFLAARIDKWFCVISFLAYTLAVTVLLVLQVQLGDHKLMLGDRPGNM